MATDWTKLRVEYVTSAVTLRELADKHGIKAAGWRGGQLKRRGRIVRMAPEEHMKTQPVIVTRWQEFTGKAATLEADGRTFAEVEAG